MIKRLVILFTVPFLVFTTLDIATTWVGIHHRGFSEINVFTDTSSIRKMLLPEIITFAFGSIAVLVGGLWKKDDLRTSVHMGFRAFNESFWLVRRLPATALIFLPVGIAIGRILPVFSNTSHLLTGWSPIIDGVLKPLSEMLGWSLFRTNMMLHGIVFGALALPVTYVVYCVCKHADRSSPPDPE